MNVLVLCVDTLRWDYVGYNKARRIRTPNIDRLAQRSTAFARCLISSFPTNPMRTDAITGNCNFPRYDWQPLAADETVLAEVMSEAGYHTALLVDTGPMAQLDRGFDEVHITFQPPADRPKPEEIPFPPGVEPKNIRQEGRQRQQQLAELAHARHECDFWVGTSMIRAAQWLEDNARRDKWLLWVDTFEVHEVWHTPPHYLELYSKNYEGLDYDFPNYHYTDIYTRKELNRLAAHYAAEVTFTDRWIGHLLTQLDVMELWDKTMVLFLSDHGTHLGEHKRTGKHTVRGWEDPWPLYEEVSHIPLLVHLPGQTRPRRLRSLAWVPDLMPTILEACKVKGPAMLGKSWLPLLSGKRRENWNEVFSSKHSAPTAPLDLCPGYLTVTTPRWTYICEEPGHKPELYDIRVDPKQRHNLARKHPEVCAQLQRRALNFLEEQEADDAYVAKFVAGA